MFFRRRRPASEVANPMAEAAADVTAPADARAHAATRPFSVRARISFADDFAAVQRELESVRRQAGSHRRVTRGETLDAMLDALRATLSAGDMHAAPVSLSPAVWEGVRRIAIATGQSPAAALEEIVIAEMLRLGLAKPRD